MIRKLLLTGLAFAAAWMAGRAVRRETQVIALLWTLVQAIAVAGTTANTAKTRAVEDRVSALVPAVGTALDNAAAAQGTATTALNAIPGNSGFLSGLQSMFIGSSSCGPNAGGAPAQSSYYAGSAPASYSQAVVQSYVNHMNFLADDVTAIRNYLNAFATTYNATVNCVQYIQSSLHAHGYSSN